MRCAKRNGCLHTERDPFSDDWETWCLNCSARIWKPIVELTTPMRQHGTCLCGNAIRSDRLDTCSSCHVERIRLGRLAAEEARKVGV